MVFYTGIGSRSTPNSILKEMEAMGRYFSKMNYRLRSGGAHGADTAFEEGCRREFGQLELWLPWEGFNDRRDGFYPRESHYEMASMVHPYWGNLSHGAKALHARNIGQVLGDDLNTPSSFTVCWTPDGCRSEEEYRPGKTGGTGTAIVLSSRMGIPVFNLYHEDEIRRVYAFAKELNRAYSLTK